MNTKIQSLIIYLGMLCLLAGMSALAQSTTITSVSPESGPVGTVVTINGSGFGTPDAGRYVTFGGVPAISYPVWTNTQIQAVVAGNAASGAIVVTLNGSGSTVTGPVFTVTAPTITSISPASGPVGTSVEIAGTSFGIDNCCQGETRTLLRGGWKSVLFNGLPMSAYFGWTGESVQRAIVPGNATTGPVVLRMRTDTTGFDANGIPILTGTATVDAVGPTFTVTLPTITSISPASGPVGTRLTLTGTNLGPTPQTILFRSLSALVLQWSDTQVVTEVPSGVSVGQAEIELRIRADVRTTGFDANGVPIVTGSYTTLTALNSDFVVTNTPPTANAGVDQTGRVGDIVTLDGSGSSDPNGESLTFAWSFVAKPTGSVATLSAATLANPQFTIDKAGSYVVQLVVNDGHQASEADTVTISTVNSPPVGNAGADQAVTVGQTVQLDGGLSFDPDGDALSYQWTLTSRPLNSAAVLFGANTTTPTFTADVFGEYEVRLTVSDGVVSSQPDSVVVSTVNVAPVANAGADQAVSIGTTVHLDGRGSTDADGQGLRYSWSFVSRPAGSATAIAEASSAQANFAPDVAGTYLVQLIVNDGVADSLPDTVSVTMVSGGLVNDRLRDAINELGLTCSDPGVFVNPNSCRALINKLEAVSRQVAARSYASARDQLTMDLLPKMDGCALRGNPDAPPSGELRDWIIRCDVQGRVYQILRQAVDELTILIG